MAGMLGEIRLIATAHSCNGRGARLHDPAQGHKTRHRGPRTEANWIIYPSNAKPYKPNSPKRTGRSKPMMAKR